jgi:hypothetical protein
MNRRRLTASLVCLCLFGILLGCTPRNDPDKVSNPSLATLPVPPPTPATDALQVNETSASGARLRVTLPSIKLLKYSPETEVQLFVVLSDPQGSYSYLLYPANRPGAEADTFDLSAFPLELSVDDRTATLSLWVLAIHNTRYEAAETFGLDSLAASLGMGFRNWLANGDPNDDPLAAVIGASKGALYEWFAGINVLGQNVITFTAEENWNVGLDSQRSPDGGLNTVYSVQYISASDVALLPTLTPTSEHPGYVLRVDETFARGQSSHSWYQGQDSTYTNQIVDGAYEIRLIDLVERDFGLSWGSLENEQFKDYIVEAQVRLVEDNAAEARYGIWFDYQDDYNFIYFGISDTGEYRVAVIQRNSNRIEVQKWTPDPILHRGAATNTLLIEADADGKITLSANAKQLISFTDRTFDGGSVAFFCYAESVPTTCRLERLRIWELAR